MTEGKYIVDDRWELPQEIRNMPKDELKKEIARLEQEIKSKKLQAKIQ